MSRLIRTLVGIVAVTALVSATVPANAAPVSASAAASAVLFETGDHGRGVASSKRGSARSAGTGAT